MFTWHLSCKHPGMIQKLYYPIMLFFCLAAFEKAHALDVTLNWDAGGSPNITGYHVYYGTTSGSYLYRIDVSNNTSATLTNLEPGLTYYIVATSQDIYDNQSPYSSEVSFTVPEVLNMAGAVKSSASPLIQFPALIQFPVFTGHWYEIQATTDLRNWISIWQSDVIVANTSLQFVDPSMGSFAQRFYRLVAH
jgi:hypothetical protein